MKKTRNIEVSKKFYFWNLKRKTEERVIEVSKKSLAAKEKYLKHFNI
jgi:hypothetical protein